MPKKTIVGDEAKTTTTLRLTDEMVERADTLAARLGITRAAVLRMSLMKGLNAMEAECGPVYVPIIRKVVDPAVPGGVRGRKPDEPGDEESVTPNADADLGKCRKKGKS
ncbi:MAG: hypothetical protein IT371_11815 [Deltaproteobacteria bacterium]|nr:hypothetical protein [Deltaproteobacteria bacterium]